MSHIFDALQRSESEQSGIEYPAVIPEPTELLKAVELLQAAEPPQSTHRAEAKQSTSLPSRSCGSPVPAKLFCPKCDFLAQEAFHRVISLERKRSERSGKSFVLMLLGTGKDLPTDGDGKLLIQILSTLSSSTRATDGTGWYSTNAIIGVMFTEIAMDDKNAVLSAILARVSGALRQGLSSEQFSQVKLSFHLFPGDWDSEGGEGPSDRMLYPDLEKRNDSRKFLRMTKRLMDISGSLFALIMLSPLYAGIAVAIKLSSRGPVLYRQRRVGEYGRCFRCLKFRTMNVSNDPSEHEEYVRQLIAGNASAISANGNGQGVFKLANDSRVTPVGKFLRRSSLDELPQFVNVLRGEMSLVGPRPAVPYEVEAYQAWHRRRLLEAKPGLTGLWQVKGRSRVRFDDMVRLDLRYARDWSLWLDLKILLQTPRAVIAGEGAC